MALRAFHDSRVELPIELLGSRAARPTTRRIIASAGRPAAGLRAGHGDRRRGSPRRSAASEARPCHNDLLAGNIILDRDSGRLMLVDWEYAGMGHPCFDLGNLSVNNDFDEATDERLLRAYHGEAAATSPRSRR